MAEQIGAAMVEQGLAACVNILAPITSIYNWQGKLQRDTETPMILKTRTQRVPALIAAIQQAHPYETPAIVAIGTSAASVPFADWIVQQTRKKID